jgi:N-acetylglutamate synthase-like GNAT family acetyltransferase
MEEIIYRKAAKKDLPQIIEILKVFKLNMLDLASEAFMAAILGGKIIGCGRIKTMDDGSLQLASIAVLPEFRNKGVASNLIKKLLAGDLRRPVYGICRKTREKFYEIFGFKAVAIEKLPDSMKKEWDRLVKIYAGVEGVAMKKED